MLSASERVKLVTAIARTLGEESWPLIDLTLEQFGLPTTDDWSGDKQAYVIWSTKSTDDETLLSLGRHLGHDSGRPAGTPEFWTPNFFRLFITHLSSHKEKATDLQAALADYGISAFVAHADIEPGSVWQAQIELALNTCDALAALLTPEFHESEWTDQEIGFVMGRGVLIVSVRYGEDPYGFIGRYQGIPGNERPAVEVAVDLVKVLVAQKETSGRMKEALAAAFEASYTFKQAVARSKEIEKVKDWPEALKKRIRDAVETNDQISGAWGVRERINHHFPSPGPAAAVADESDDMPF